MCQLIPATTLMIYSQSEHGCAGSLGHMDCPAVSSLYHPRRSEPELPGRYTFFMGLLLYAATTSQGKLRDFRTAAQAHSVRIETLPGLEEIAAPEENGS